MLVLSVAALPWRVTFVGVMLMLVSSIAVAAGILDAAMASRSGRCQGMPLPASDNVRLRMRLIASKFGS